MEAGQQTVLLRVSAAVRRRAAGLVLALALVGTSSVGHGTAYDTGTLIAVFATRTEILLCSDGRVVNSVSRATIRDDWPKIHRLTDLTGLLTAGRDLPRLRDQFAAKLGNQRPQAVSAVATVLRGALEAGWTALTLEAGRAPAGRAFAVVAGFDADGPARLFYMDSASKPPFLLQPVSLFATGQDLEVFAISSNVDANEDVSSLLVRHVDALARAQPGADRRRLMLAAFAAAKQELATRNTSIGGDTFAAVITPAGGYEPLR